MPETKEVPMVHLTINHIPVTVPKGTKMISVAGNVNAPGVFEIPFGTTLRDIIAMAGGVQGGRRIQVLQIGGASGKVQAGTDAVLDTPYTY